LSLPRATRQSQAPYPDSSRSVRTRSAARSGLPRPRNGRDGKSSVIRMSPVSALVALRRCREQGGRSAAGWRTGACSRSSCGPRFFPCGREPPLWVCAVQRRRYPAGARSTRQPMNRCLREKRSAALGVGSRNSLSSAAVKLMWRPNGYPLLPDTGRLAEDYRAFLRRVSL
jgi:hypothetical protein